MLSALIDYSVTTNFFFFAKLFVTSKELYQIFQNNIKISVCLYFIEPLRYIASKDTKIMCPHNFWSDNINIIFNCLYACEQGKHIIYSFGEKSRLSRYRVHELNNILIKKYPKYREKTMHKTIEKINPNYWSDEEGNNGEEVWETTKTHYIILTIRPKITKKFLTIRL